MSKRKSNHDVTRRAFAAGILGGAVLGATARSPLLASSRTEQTATVPEEGVTVDANFPGGNIIVERIEGRDVYLRQDLRDTEGWWFYWYFRVRARPGTEWRFHFTNQDVFTCRGPAVKIGQGPWRWLGRDALDGTTLSFIFPADAEEARFCLAIPYLEDDLRRFLDRFREDPFLKVADHCLTRKGRRTERLHFGCLRRPPAHRVLLTCRHHACEMAANWVLEGLIEAVLRGPHAAWFCENVEFAAVPFMDKDGVEEGDQGKNRRPHDHNQDYLDEPIYPSVRAMKEFVPDWSGGILRAALDLHCPYIRGGRDEEVFLVGNPDARIQGEIDRFSQILEVEGREPIPYRSQNNIPFGVGWNTEMQPRMFSRWASSLPGIRFATTLEFPYACAGKAAVDQTSGRGFGACLAAALRQYLISLA